MHDSCCKMMIILLLFSLSCSICISGIHKYFYLVWKIFFPRQEIYSTINDESQSDSGSQCMSHLHRYLQALIPSYGLDVTYAMNNFSESIILGGPRRRTLFVFEGDLYSLIEFIRCLPFSNDGRWITRGPLLIPKIQGKNCARRWCAYCLSRQDLIQQQLTQSFSCVCRYIFRYIAVLLQQKLMTHTNIPLLLSNLVLLQ